MKISVALEVEADDALIAIEFLLDNIQLSKSRLKRLMNTGGVWLRREDAPRYRLRRAMTDLKVGDVLEIFYDDALLDQPMRLCDCLSDHEIYSLWHKPVGVFSQGSDWGDHNSLERQAVLHFHKQRPVWLLNTLSGAGRGVILVAHHRRAQAGLEALMADGAMEATFRVTLQGDQRWLAVEGLNQALPEAIRPPLDIQVRRYQTQPETTTLLLTCDQPDLTELIRWCAAMDLELSAIGDSVPALTLLEGDPEAETFEPEPPADPSEPDTEAETLEDRAALVGIDLIQLRFECPFTGESREPSL